MHLLFCDNPLNPREPDEVYAPEYAAAQACGFYADVCGRGSDSEGLCEVGEAPVAGGVFHTGGGDTREI